jgi:hypothetical protein
LREASSSSSYFSAISDIPKIIVYCRKNKKRGWAQAKKEALK